MKNFSVSFKVNDLCYSITSSLNKTVEVTNEKSYGDGIPSYSNIPSAVVIPSEVVYNGTTYAVTAIGDQAFRSCCNMKSVSIPEGIKTIGFMSFEACGELSSLELPSTLTSIGWYGIENCQGLQSIICKAAVPPTCGSWALNFNIKLNASHPTGTCVIYVPSNSVSAYKADSPWNSFSIEPINNSANAVDLGLSVKWASCNFGASEPEEYGGLYGWADATGSKTSTNKNDYPSSTPPTEISGTECDIAKAKWGGNWRLPTADELSELNSKCTWTWITVNGIKGKKATGPNGNSIFIPASGNRKCTTIYERGQACFLWSGDLLGGVYGRALHLHESDHFISYTDRYVGLSVRPVLNS